MKYYSDITKKVYDTENALVAAEKAVAKEQAEKAKKELERKERAKEVNEAFKKAYELRDKFIRDYGSYHQTVTKEDINFDDIFNLLFKF